jgi:hypothetical protein
VAPGIEGVILYSEMDEQRTEERRNLGGLAAEADRGSHRVTDLARQIQRHKGGVTMIAGGLLLIAGSLAGLAMLRRHHERKPAVKLRRIGEVLLRLFAAPARKEPGIFRRALTALATTVLATVVKRFAERQVAPMLLAAAGDTEAPLE